MVATRLYVERGGNSKALRTECRRAFREFLHKAGLAGRMPRIIACGPRRQACDDFCTQSEQRGQDVLPVLLVDSEGPVSTTSPWRHLADPHGDNWPQPSNATDDQCHLMVQCMETWMLADRDAMTSFFGQGFRAGALPDNSDIETIPKHTVPTSLEDASRGCATKGVYSKGDHSFKLLALVDPSKVARASRWANRFVITLDRITAS